MVWGLMSTMIPGCAFAWLILESINSLASFLVLFKHSCSGVGRATIENCVLWSPFSPCLSEFILSIQLGFRGVSACPFSVSCSAAFCVVAMKWFEFSGL